MKIAALSRKDFNNKLRARGFHQTATFGVWRMPVPCSKQKLREDAGGDTLRARLAWMITRYDEAVAAHLAGGG
jgi:hypothetical protein